MSLLVLVLPSMANSDNLVTNGGFETGDFTGWSVTPTVPPGMAVIESSYVHSGQYAVELTSEPFSPLGELGATLTTQPGTAYTLSFYLAVPIAPAPYPPLPRFTLDWSPTTATTVLDTIFTSRSDWTLYTFTEIVALSATTFINLSWHISPDYGPCPIFLDDISVSSVPEPDILVCLGPLLAGLLVGARKFKCI